MSLAYPHQIDATFEPVRLGDGSSGSDGFLLPVAESKIPLMLHVRRTGGRPVLLLHGASAGSDTFLTPRPGAGGCQNLVDYLANAGFEPWLLDWRGSKYVSGQVPRSMAGGMPAPVDFNFDAAATQDIAAALDVIAKEQKQKGQDRKISAVGFCMGGGILAQALLDDRAGVSDRLSNVVLMSLGLFYSMNFHGRLKAESRLLERVVSDEPERLFLDPGVKPGTTKLENAWPAHVESLYELWRRPYDEARIKDSGVIPDDQYVLEMFNRISFMLGQPYLETDLVPEIHETTVTLTIVRDRDDRDRGPLPVGALVRARDADGVEGQLAYPVGAGDAMVLRRCRGEFGVGQALIADGRQVGSITHAAPARGPLLPDLFGPMAIGFLLHGAENLRAGQATRIRDDPAKQSTAHISAAGDPYAGFNRLNRTTLIGGALNRLWHRDSIDRMAAWLARNGGRGRQRFVKHILPDFGHQDLLWGRRSREVVFPRIQEGLEDETSRCVL